jgi:hypothetical protein
MSGLLETIYFRASQRPEVSLPSKDQACHRLDILGLA